MLLVTIETIIVSMVMGGCDPQVAMEIHGDGKG